MNNPFEQQLLTKTGFIAVHTLVSVNTFCSSNKLLVLFLVIIIIFISKYIFRLSRTFRMCLIDLNNLGVLQSDSLRFLGVEILCDRGLKLCSGVMIPQSLERLHLWQ